MRYADDGVQEICTAHAVRLEEALPLRRPYRQVPAAIERDDAQQRGRRRLRKRPSGDTDRSLPLRSRTQRNEKSHQHPP